MGAKGPCDDIGDQNTARNTQNDLNSAPPALAPHLPQHNERRWREERGLFTEDERVSSRRVDIGDGPFIERIGLPHSISRETGRLTCIIPPGFPGIVSWTYAR
jgi:hypothetical protein